MTVIDNKKLMIAYCPICDEDKIMFSESEIAHCPECNHHLNLRAVHGIEVVPVVHGRWRLCTEEDEYSVSEHFKCNICNAMHYSDDNYCPCCGAKMDLETNNE